MTTEHLEQKLLNLPADERARIAARLISSLDDEAAIEEAWREEVRRRDQELSSGTVSAVDWKEARAALRNRFGW